MHLVLASASPRRAELLAAAGYTFEVLPVDVNEEVLEGESPSAYVERLANVKAAAGLAQRPGAIVLGADTAVVVAGGRILGKARDEGEARDILLELSGRTHDVLTGVAAHRAGGQWSAVACTTVQFAPLSGTDLDWYLASGEWRDKAGAYGVQGRAGRFIPQIDGSYSNVVGPPVALVFHLLRQAGL